MNVNFFITTYIKIRRIKLIPIKYYKNDYVKYTEIIV